MPTNYHWQAQKSKAASIASNILTRLAAQRTVRESTLPKLTPNA
jgi:hypothetical protein